MPSRGKTLAVWAAIAAVPILAQAQQPAASPDERVQLLEKRLSIAEREADLAKRRLQELQKEMNELGPYLDEARRRKLVDEIAKQTARIRALPLKRQVDPVVLDRSSLRELLDRLLAMELTEQMVRGMTLTWQTFEMLPPDADLNLLYRGLLEEQVGGLYNQRDGSLYVVDTFDPKSLVGRIILAHEVCHAIQDQNYPIKDLPFQTKNEDQNMAMASVIEGDATLLMIEWAGENFKPSDLLTLGDVFKQSTEQLETVPPAMVQSMIFPYIAGMEFMTHVVSSRGPARRNEPFEKPPASTEQILHPEKYVAGNDAPVAVELPPWTERDGMTEAMRGPVGEWMTRLVLTGDGAWPKISFGSTELLVSEPTAVDGAAGWGGDLLQCVASADGSRRFVAWKGAWDTEADAVEFRDALAARIAAWEKFAGASWTDTTDDRETRTINAGNGWNARLQRSGKWTLLVLATGEKELATAREWLGDTSIGP